MQFRENLTIKQKKNIVPTMLFFVPTMLVIIVPTIYKDCAYKYFKPKLINAAEVLNLISNTLK